MSTLSRLGRGTVVGLAVDVENVWASRPAWGGLPTFQGRRGDGLVDVAVESVLEDLPGLGRYVHEVLPHQAHLRLATDRAMTGTIVVMSMSRMRSRAATHRSIGSACLANVVPPTNDRP